MDRSYQETLGTDIRDHREPKRPHTILERYSAHHSHAKEQLDAKKDELKDSQAARSVLENKLKESQAAYSDLEETVKEYQARRTILEEIVKEHQLARSDLEDTLKESQAANSDLKNEVRQLNIKHAESATRVDTLQAQNSELCDKVTSLEDDLKGRRKEYSEQKQHHDNELKRINGIHHDKEKALEQESNAKLKSQREVHEAEVRSKDDVIKGLRRDLAEAQLEAESAKAAKRQLEQDMIKFREE